MFVELAVYRTATPGASGEIWSPSWTLSVSGPAGSAASGFSFALSGPSAASFALSGPDWSPSWTFSVSAAPVVFEALSGALASAGSAFVVAVRGAGLGRVERHRAGLGGCGDRRFRGALTLGRRGGDARSHAAEHNGNPEGCCKLASVESHRTTPCA